MINSRPGMVLALVAPDIVTKSRRTRQRFITTLERNLREALEQAGIPFDLSIAGTRFLIRTEADDAAVSVARHVFGIATVARVEAVLPADPEVIARHGGEIFREAVTGKRFAVRAKKLTQYPFSRQDVERALGAALNGPGKVDLTRPEITVFVELSGDRALLFSNRQAGAGGLPAGIQGRALSLISGGFDSAVASWRMMRRGAELHYLYCNLGGVAHERMVLQVVKVLHELWGFGLRPRLHVVDFVPIVQELRQKTRKNLWQLVLKVMFYRAAAIIARKERADAVVTGEALGQVSSQTLPNLATLDRFAEMPMLRPLLGHDKNEIMAEARRIGTGPLSERIPEMCGLAADRPAVTSRVGVLAAEVDKLSPELLRRLVEARRTIDVAAVRPEDLREPYLFVEEFAEDAVVIDCREPEEYRLWHVPGAVNLPVTELLDNFRRLERNRRYILYCTFGTQTPLLAERMQQAGFEAYAFRGGLAAVRRAVGEDLALLL